MLQRNSTHLKLQYQFEKNRQHLSAGKKSTSSLMFSLRYCKDIVSWLFLVLWACLAMHTQSHFLENVCVYLEAKSQLHHLCFYGNIPKICKLILGTLGMPCYTGIMVSPCRRFRCLSACKKINFIIHFFLMVLHFKESCNLIGWQHFGP